MQYKWYENRKAVLNILMILSFVFSVVLLFSNRQMEAGWVAVPGAIVFGLHILSVLHQGGL
jgi:hypothetical protein